jgi:transposase
VAYQAHGIEGLRTKQGCVRYSAELKQAVVARMRKEGLSYRQVAGLPDVRNFNIIGLWEQQYDDGSLPGLITGRETSIIKMPKTPTQKNKPPADANSSREVLLAEVNQLRMENTC